MEKNKYLFTSDQYLKDILIKFVIGSPIGGELYLSKDPVSRVACDINHHK